MFHHLKQTKQTVPIRRRIGVLRRYEEGREWIWDDGSVVKGTGEAGIEDMMGEWEEIQQEAYGEGETQGISGRPDCSDREEHTGGERSMQPEIIVIDDDDEEETHSTYSGPLHKCPLCPRTFKLPNGLALHLKWHWGQTSLDWKRGIGKHGRIIERANEAKEAAEARAKEITEAQAASSSPTLKPASEGTARQDSDDMFISSATGPVPRPITAPAGPGGFCMPFMPTATSEDPFNFFPSRPSIESRNDAPRPSPTLLPPVRAGAFDIGVGSSRGTSDPLSTPELSPGPSRSSDGDSMECNRNRESSWSDDLFGPDEEEMQVRSTTLHGTREA
ncbi:uncharacterized protein B0H18DRAFT_1043996 [Fomitopsis serialis]|uniref:uncharacterized protein n=1 Tax=Fomitopsis serialis TaxID=139415 RepID=UPI00200752D7|nr:uncharacterized protein B0H18DRAFT_1043996 [Neoantrodia serialis]KAH9914801.1 hypothetical protein B0H18DRAFT_1043996 [Neoantrodia serialis]